MSLNTSNFQVSIAMAEVRARIDFKVGVTSSIDAELLSFHGLKTDKEHVAVIFKSADKTQD
ncbi:GTP cyclohydrolase, partial [Vibrio coralliirubri]